MLPRSESVLADRYAKARSKPETVHWAAETGDLNKLKELIEKGVKEGQPEGLIIQTREDVLGLFPLHVACENGHIDIVEFLLKRQVDVDAGDHYRVTALHLAAINNHTTVLQMLLRARADPKPKDVEHDLPIHWAATKGNIELRTTVAGEGEAAYYDPNTIPNRTELFQLSGSRSWVGCRNRPPKILVIKQLAKARSPIDSLNARGWTPLHRAAYNGRKDACTALVDLGADINCGNTDGNTPLHLAAYMNQLSTMERLCQLAARLDLANNLGQTCRDMCITDGARELLETYGYSKHKAQSQGSDAKVTKGSVPISGTSTAAVILGPSKVEAAMARLSVMQARKEKQDDGFPTVSTPTYSTNTKRISQESSAVWVAEADADELKQAAQPWTIQHQLSRPARENNSETSVAGALQNMRPPSGTLRVLAPLRPGSAGTSLGTGSLSPWPSSPHPESPSLADKLHLGPAASNNSYTSSPVHSEDYQDKLKEETRTFAAASGAGLLSPRPARPTSANKRFLAKYGLEKHSLFAP